MEEINTQIFEVHQMMLEDLDYIESIENIIKNQNLNAEYAVAQTADNMAYILVYGWWIYEGKSYRY